MLQTFLSRSAALLPQSALGHLGWLRGSLGATLAIGLSGLTTWLLLGTNSADLPWLVAPLGASAVLVLGVPASPLAQPWSLIGGNCISSVIGLSLGIYIGSPLIAASLAVGLSIAAMTFARCLHPPGGACALLCALGAGGADGWGWTYLLPIVGNVLTLALVGWLYNNLTGHNWPHHVELPPREPAVSAAAHTREDIEAVLSEWNEMLDVDVDDLDAFYLALNRYVDNRHSSAGRGS